MHVTGAICILWAAGAILYDLPVEDVIRQVMAVLFVTVTVFFWYFGRSRMRLIAPLLFLLVLGWWFTLRPSDTRDWLPDADRTAWAEVNGDVVTIHNLRNCEYWSETEYKPVWETRVVDLSRITGIDLAITYWGSPLIAHPVASFQFEDGDPVCFSIETRKEKGESYSSIGGFYRQYELIFIVADEKDVIRLRTNYRKGEDVYLYRLNITPEEARERFMEYVAAMNDLHQQPAWYHAVTANCTTAIRSRHTGAKAPWDWRMLVNGYMDEMLYERGAIGDGSMPFPELKSRSLINREAIAAGKAEDFSKRIREGSPLSKGR